MISLAGLKKHAPQFLRKLWLQKPLQSEKVGIHNAINGALPRLQEFPSASPQEIADLLQSMGFPLRSIDIDQSKLQTFRKQWDYSTYHYGTPEDTGPKKLIWEEKSLEHFLSVELLELNSTDILIDIASSNSNFAQNARKEIGCRAYQQDLIFPPGIQEDRIGGSATDIPVDSSSITKLTLHCSFEHFEGNADSGFMTEAARILQPGGSLCIIPFYVCPTHLILTDPEYWKREVPLDPGASWLFQSFYNRFGRVYSPQAMTDRIIPYMNNFAWEIVWFKNRPQLFPDLWCNFALIAKKTDRPSDTATPL